MKKLSAGLLIVVVIALAACTDSVPIASNGTQCTDVGTILHSVWVDPTTNMVCH